MERGGGDFIWGTAANWGGTLPTIADIGLFNTALTGNITLAAATSVGSINFDTNANNSSTNNLIIGTIGGNSLTFANAGNLSILASLTGTGKTFTVNAPIILTPASATTAGAFTIQNNATSATNGLVVAGGISSGTTTNTETLTLGGTNTGNNLISGIISNGSATIFAVTKTGAGTWTLSGANTYNGATTVSGGTLDVANSLALQNSTLTTGAGAVTFDQSVGGNAFTIGGLAGSTNLSLLNTGSTATALTVSGKTGTYSGTLTGASSVTVGANAAAANGGNLTIGAAGSIGTAGTPINVTDNPNAVVPGGGVPNTPNLTNSGTISGNLTIAAPTTGTAFAVSGGGTAIAGETLLNGGSSTSANGTITVNGGLQLAGSTALTLGTLASSGTGGSGTGAIFNSNTYNGSATTFTAANGVTYNGGNALSFAPGTSLFRYATYAGSDSTLTTSGIVNIFSFGQTGTGNNFTATLNGGIWNIGQVGQNSSLAQNGGVTNILGGAAVYLGVTGNLGSTVWTGAAGGGFMHGVYNIGGPSSGSLAVTSTAIGEGNGTAGTSALQFTVGNAGALTAPGITLATAVVQGVATTNSLTVNTGGTATFTGNAVLGSIQTQTALENNTITVAGGTYSLGANALNIGTLTSTNSANQANAFTETSGTATTGALTLGSGATAASNTITNTVNFSGGTLTTGAIAANAGTNQTNTFNWTGGTLTTTGVITPSAGFNGSGSSINSTGVIVPSGGTLNFNLSGTQTAGYVISGGGAFTDSGTGTQTLTGANTYTGATTIGSGGTLQLGNGTTGNDGSVASTSGVADSGTLAFNLFGPQTAGYVIGGSGAVTKSGVGTLTLTGANTYTGATTIGSGGTLQLGNGTTDGSIANTSSVADSGTLVYNLASNRSPAYIISGSGAVTEMGSSTLTFTQANTYTGATTIGSGGTLQLGNGTTGNDGSVASTSGVADSGTLAFNLFGPQTAGYVVSGTGAVTKSGAGTLTLSKTNTYSGPTAVNGGTLTVSGSTAAASTVTVGVSGTLTGAGTINGSVINNGTLHGGTPGTLSGTAANNKLTLGSSGGTVTFAGGSTLGFDFNATTSDLLSSTAAFSFTGTGSGTSVINLVGNQLATPTAASYTLATFASGLSGTPLGDFLLSGISGYTLSISGNSLLLSQNAQGFFYNGAAGGALNNTSGATTNFATDITGATNNTGALSSAADAYFGANNAANTTITSLGANTSVKGVIFTASGTTTGATVSNSYNISDSSGSTLTVGSDGILDSAGAAAQTLNVPIVLGSAVTVTNNSSNLLTLGGITGAFNLTAAGSGNTAITGVIGTSTGTFTQSGSGTTTLAGANTYTGVTTLTSGTLDVANQLALKSSTLTTGAGAATFDSSVTGNAFTVGGLAGSTNLSLLNTGSIPIALTLGTNTAAYSGILSGAGASLIQNGAGTQTLSGANTYTGGTTVTAGTLSIASTGSIAGGAATVNGGTLSNSGTVGAVTVNGGTLTANASSTTGAVTLGSTGASNATLNLAGTTGATVGTISNSATVGASAPSPLFNGVITDADTGTESLTFGNATLASITNTAAGGVLNLSAPGATVNFGNLTGGIKSTGTNSSIALSNGTFVEGISYGSASNQGSLTGNNGNITINNGATLNMGLVRGFYGNFTVNNGGTWLLETGGNDSGNNSQPQFGNGAPANSTNTISITPGSLLNMYAPKFTVVLDPTNAGTTGTTTVDVTQTGGTAEWGVTPGPNGAGNAAFTIGFNTLTTAVNNTSAYYSLSGGTALFAETIASGSVLGTNETTGFNWTGGTLSFTGLDTSRFNQAGSSILNSTLTNSAGTLIPGGYGTVGTSTLTGNYVQTSGGTLAINVVNDTFGKLAVSGTINLGGTLTFSASGTQTLGKYALITDASGLNNSSYTATGAAPTNYVFSKSDTELDLLHEATVGIAPAAAAYNGRVGTSVNVGVNVSNTAPVNSDTLAYSLSGAFTGSGGPVAGNATDTAQTGTVTVSSVGANTYNETATGTGSGSNPTTNGSANTLITVNGYSGQETYTGASGNYVNGTNATVQSQWNFGGAPGIDAGFTGQDTATINGTGNGNAGQTVDLVNASPNLAALTLGNGSTVTSSGTGTLTLDGTNASVSGGTNGTATVTATGTGNAITAPTALATNTTATVTGSGDTLTVSGSVTGTGNLTKAGAGTLTLTGTDSATGTTTVSAGTLALNNTGGAAITNSNLTVASNGAVVVQASNQLGTADTTTNVLPSVTLSGGTVTAANNSSLGNSTGPNGSGPNDGAGAVASSFGAGTLTLSGGNSYLDFGADNTGEVIAFSSFSGLSGNLYILNYNDGNFLGGFTPASGGGIDQLFFGGSGQTAQELMDVYFVNPIGKDGQQFNQTYEARLLSTGEVVAPEPSQWVSLLVGALGLSGLALKARKRKAGAAA